MLDCRDLHDACSHQYLYMRNRYQMIPKHTHVPNGVPVLNELTYFHMVRKQSKILIVLTFSVTSWLLLYI